MVFTVSPHHTDFGLLTRNDRERTPLILDRVSIDQDIVSVRPDNDRFVAEAAVRQLA